MVVDVGSRRPYLVSPPGYYCRVGEWMSGVRLENRSHSRAAVVTAAQNRQRETGSNSSRDCFRRAGETAITINPIRVSISLPTEVSFNQEALKVGGKGMVESLTGNIPTSVLFREEIFFPRANEEFRQKPVSPTGVDLPKPLRHTESVFRSFFLA